MKWSLGGHSVGSDNGAVSSLSFSPDSTRLIAGFAKGAILEYDITNGKLLQVQTMKSKLICALLT